MELVKYDSETGVFTWIKTRTSTASAGTVAGSVSKTYVTISIDGCRYKAHRWLGCMFMDLFPKAFWITSTASKQTIELPTFESATRSRMAKIAP